MSQSALSPSITSGVRFDYRYDLNHLLGSGQFGEVWRAVDSNTGRTVALKLVDPTFTTTSDAWREATRLTSLESPYLIKVHGAALSQLGIPYLDMEYVPNGNVKARVPARGVNESQAVRWAQRAAQGLQLCHDHGVLHRDVKPDNLLLNHTDDVLLGDFGVAATMAADKTADAHGHCEIMAPEVFGGGRCSVASDVYSLGVTLYALVTGKVPHALADYGNDMSALAAAVQAGVPDVRLDAPHPSLGITKVIRTATSPDPQQRYQTVADMGTALARLSAPRRLITEVAPCHPSGRCWDAVAPPRSPGRDIHVCSAPGARPGSVKIETHYPGGNRLTQHCDEVTAGKAGHRLKAVFRGLLSP